MYDMTKLTFIEHPGFTDDLTQLADDETYHNFQSELAERIESWPVIR